MFITLRKTSSQDTTTINTKFMLGLGMILLIYLMVLILMVLIHIQDYFEFIIKKHETLAEIPPVQNKIKNRIVFKIKTGYKLELLTPETKKLLGSGKKDVDKDKDGENVTKLESVEVVLVHCNLVKNNYQYTSKVLFTFGPNKHFEQLFHHNSLTMMNTVNPEFSSVKVWFIDQTSKALEIEDNVNLTVIIG